MNRRQHVIIGIIAFAVYIYLTNPSSDDAVWGFLAVIAGSIIPDILEPPTGWDHRDLLHSVGALKLTAIIFILTALIGLYVISCFFLGYLFHLLADATTPMGLPD